MMLQCPTLNAVISNDSDHTLLRILLLYDHTISKGKLITNFKGNQTSQNSINIILILCLNSGI